LKSVDVSTLASSIILTVTCLISLVARLLFPEVIPIVEDMTIIFYLILAVTIIALLRNLLGLTTYGVFGPAIVSLGLTRIGDAVVGLIILLIILLVGLVVRLLLEPLRVQMTHRMAIVVITVASTMGIIKYVGFRLGNDPLTYASFLPILISSWIVERFSRHRKENGWKIALTRLTYTFIAIFVTFYLISDRRITDYFIHTPETWIVPVAINLLFGSCVRIRLSEFFRFKEIGRSGRWPFVLTMNVRNREIIEKYNPREKYNKTLKLESKNLLNAVGIPVPRTIAVFDGYRDLKNLENILSKIPSETGFVIKPNNSSGGSGIMIVNKKNGSFLESDGKELSYRDIRSHIEQILDGEYSRGWDPDQAYLEEILYPHPVLEKLAYSGLPDIRLIVFKGIPIMGMIRLPTKKSEGKANLHQGAIGAGIDLTTGKIKNAVVAYEKKPIIYHPDTHVKIVGCKIPFWSQILKLAVKSQRVSGLGYVGVDITIDREKGPVVMEINKRPGMEIQNANREPLLKRIRAVEEILKNNDDISVEDGIRLGLSLEENNWEK